MYKPYGDTYTVKPKETSLNQILEKLSEFNGYVTLKTFCSSIGIEDTFEREKIGEKLLYLSKKGQVIKTKTSLGGINQYLISQAGKNHIAMSEEDVKEKPKLKPQQENPMTEAANTNAQLDKALADIEHRIKSPTVKIDNLDAKRKVLTHLARVTDDPIAEILDEILEDIETISDE